MSHRRATEAAAGPGTSRPPESFQPNCLAIPDQRIAVPDKPRVLRECPDCGRPIGAVLANDVACPRRRQRP